VVHTVYTLRIDVGWMEKKSLARALMQLATLATACRSVCDTFLTAGGSASESVLGFGASGAGVVSAETQMTPFKPKISWTPARARSSKPQLG